jgi:hypothetical protein
MLDPDSMNSMIKFTGFFNAPCFFLIYFSPYSFVNFCRFFPQVDPNEIYLRLEQVADDTPTNAKVTLVSEIWYSSIRLLFGYLADLFILELGKP